LPQQLKQLDVKSWLHVALSVQGQSEDGFGMHGSGMFILNPPWTLHDELKQVMPYLVKLLGQDENASFELEFKENL
jgi:23S rRNA (adenine2030-N6)-methyltransferase